MTITIISFGHQSAPRPEGAHLLVDLREGFANPAPHLGVHAVFPDPDVIEHVLTTEGIPALIDALVAAADTLARVQEQVTVAVGCAGGHHRAPTVADQIAARLTQRGRETVVTHRDLHTPIEATAPEQEVDEGVDIDDPIEMPEGAHDFALPARPRSTEDPDQARARMEALVSVWTEGFQAYDLSRALADQHGLTRPRSWILTELRRLEAEGLLECDDYGRWTPTT